MGEGTVKIYARIHECKDLFGLSRATMYRGKDAHRWNIYKVGGVALVKIAEVMKAIEEDAISTTNCLGGQLGGQRNAQNPKSSKNNMLIKGNGGGTGI